MWIERLLPSRTWRCLCAVVMALGAGACATPGHSPERLVEQDQSRLRLTLPPGQGAGNGASGLVVAAMGFLGVPYRRGGNDEDGFDCSGFTRHLFETRLGLRLPRRADEQAHSPDLVAVARNELQPGDLVFFNTLRRTFSHVGIYIGDGRFIHAPRPGAEVRLESMRVAYWSTRFTGARRPAGAVDAGIREAAASAPTAESVPGMPPMY